MGFISNYKSIFENILSLVLQNRFADIEQLSDLQNEALRVKSDHRSKFSNLSNWKEEA